MKRKEFPMVVRRKAHTRSGGKCEKCSVPFTMKNPADFHHVVAAKDGGPGTLENCQVLCFSCHRPGARLAKHRRAIIGINVFQMRVNQDFLKLIDDWRVEQPGIPSRAEAIRRMVRHVASMKVKKQ